MNLIGQPEIRIPVPTNPYLGCMKTVFDPAFTNAVWVCFTREWWGSFNPVEGVPGSTRGGYLTKYPAYRCGDCNTRFIVGHHDDLQHECTEPRWVD